MSAPTVSVTCANCGERYSTPAAFHTPMPCPRCEWDALQRSDFNAMLDVEAEEMNREVDREIARAAGGIPQPEEPG